MINRPEGFHNSKEIKAIRDRSRKSVNAFVLWIRRHGADCTMDEYEDIENDVLCQSEITEKAFREIENLQIGDECYAYCYDECNAETLHKLTKNRVNYTVEGETVDGFVLVWECQQCYDGWFEDDYEVESQDVLLRKKKNHLLTGAEMISIREKLGMRRSEFVDFINKNGGDIDLETYEEFESDYDTQSTGLDKVIRGIADTSNKV